AERARHDAADRRAFRGMEEDGAARRLHDTLEVRHVVDAVVADDGELVVEELRLVVEEERDVVLVAEPVLVRPARALVAILAAAETDDDVLVLPQRLGGPEVEALRATRGVLLGGEEVEVVAAVRRLEAPAGQDVVTAGRAVCEVLVLARRPHAAVHLVARAGA